MLKNLEIQDFRGFHRFRVPRLGRVNLLVGMNNSGKTSILEAVDILTSQEGFAPVWLALRRRDEVFPSHHAGPYPKEVDVRHLFRGHALGLGSRFALSARAGRGEWSMTATVVDRESEPSTLIGSTPWDLKLSLVRGGVAGQESRLPLDPDGRPRASSSLYELVDRRPLGRPGFINATSLTAADAAALFDLIVLTPQEDMVLDAMRLIDPGIERVAVAAAEMNPRFERGGSKGGILVRLKGFDDPVPIGGMGDGVWRLFALALAAVRSSGSVLLVDEIDTGLHYTVLREMWKFLDRCAKTYNVQVVATTHSWDCCQALAAICGEDVSEDDVVLIRIEKDREEAVVYSEQAIVAAAERGIEVR